MKLKAKLVNSINIFRIIGKYEPLYLVFVVPSILISSLLTILYVYFPKLFIEQLTNGNTYGDMPWCSNPWENLLEAPALCSREKGTRRWRSTRRKLDTGSACRFGGRGSFRKRCGRCLPDALRSLAARPFGAVITTATTSPAGCRRNAASSIIIRKENSRRRWGISARSISQG